MRTLRFSFHGRKPATRAQDIADIKESVRGLRVTFNREGTYDVQTTPTNGTMGGSWKLKGRRIIIRVNEDSYALPDMTFDARRHRIHTHETSPQFGTITGDLVRTR